MSKLFTNVDRIGVGTKVFFVAIAILLMWGYSLENKPVVQQSNSIQSNTTSATATVPRVSSLAAPAITETPLGDIAPKRSALDARSRRRVQSPPSNQQSESHAGGTISARDRLTTGDLPAPPKPLNDSIMRPQPTTPTEAPVQRNVSATPSMPAGVETPPQQATVPLTPTSREPATLSPVTPRSSRDQRNLYACLNGIVYNCDKDLLTQEERQEVYASDLRRNLSACLNGISYNCDKNLLTPEERDRVHLNDLRRNLSACLNGISYNCNKSLLPPEERQQVYFSDLRRNLSACLNGISYNCDKRLLTPEQLIEVQVNESRRKR